MNENIVNMFVNECWSWYLLGRKFDFLSFSFIEDFLLYNPILGISMVPWHYEKTYLKSCTRHFGNIVCRLGLICRCHLLDNLATQQIFIMINVENLRWICRHVYWSTTMKRWAFKSIFVKLSFTNVEHSAHFLANKTQEYEKRGMTSEINK